jgi:hypothetical protein
MSIAALAESCNSLLGELRSLSDELRPWGDVLAQLPIPNVDVPEVEPEPPESNTDDVISQIKSLTSAWDQWAQGYRLAAAGARKEQNLQEFVNSLELQPPPRDTEPFIFELPAQQEHRDGLWAEYSQRPPADPRAEIRAQVKLFVSNRLRTNRFVSDPARISELLERLDRAKQPPKP